MPTPDAFAAPTAEAQPTVYAQDTTSYTLSRTTMRLRAGTYTFYRFSDAGRQLARRSVSFATAVRVRAAAQPVRFGDRQFTRITNGTWDTWYVPTPNASPQSVTTFDTPRAIQLAPTSYTGLRFYARGRITTRRIATLSSAMTVHASKRATFNAKQFFLLTDGPLAGRWLPVSSVTTSSGSGSVTAPAPAPSDSTVATVTWKTLVLVYRETDVTFKRADGSTYRLQARLGDSMYGTAVNAVKRTVGTINNWSGDLAALNMKIVDVPHPVTRVAPLGSAYWVSPDSVAADLDRYAPPGTYDSVVVIWNNRDSKGVVLPVGGWGLSVGPTSWSNGAGFSSVITGQDWYWTGTYPEEIFVHEWMHQVIFFHEYTGRMKFDLHASAQYGYTSVDGSWKRWLSDAMRGRVYDGSSYLGVTPKLWQVGTPTDQ